MKLRKHAALLQIISCQQGSVSTVRLRLSFTATKAENHDLLDDMLYTVHLHGMLRINHDSCGACASNCAHMLCLPSTPCY